MENIESFHFISIPDSRLISNEKRNLLPNGSYLTENVHFFSLANLPNEFYPSIYKAEKFYELENVLLELLFQKLNLMHQSEWTKKDYEILVSHWLQGFLTILEKKLTCMSKILNHREISSSTFFAPDLGIIAPKDFSDFVDKTFDPIWNNMLDGEIWEYLTQNEFQNLIPNYIRYMGSSNLSKYLNERRSLRYFFKRLAFDFYQKFVTCFLYFAVAKQKYLIINSYLPKATELKLKLKLKQLPFIFPFFIRRKMSDRNTIWSELRSAPPQTYSTTTITKEEFYLKLCLKYIPKIYLEGFSELNTWAIKKAKKSKVKLIFTSNNFESDEPFKYWLIQMKKLHSAKYMVGQHGNRYGVRRIFRFHEVETCDKFLTWGQTTNIEKDIPMFNLKTAGLRPINPKKDGRILLTQDIFPLQFDWAGDYYSFQEYFKMQLKFLNSLPEKIKNDLDLRLHKGSYRSPFNEIEKWKSAGFSESLSDPWESFPALLENYRLVIHGYDTTGLLESLNLNFPTLCFIHFPAEDLSKFHENLYQELIKVGIIHHSIESLTEKLIEINSFENLSYWWNSGTVQSAISNFCNELSKKVQNPVKVLAKTFENVLNS